jgi:putative flavoprotein involved in K+ transport
MTEQLNTVVIGAGQAGLAVSYCLTRQKRDHVVLERQRIGEAWRSGKWDSFTLVSPNWTLQLPGFPYQGDDPNGYFTREEVVQYLESYVRLFNPPVRSGVEVWRVARAAAGLRVETNQGTFLAENVVVATGAFQKPRLPASATQLAPHILQLHSSRYRNPDDLPPDAVLVVGSGQSGCQIADELNRQGRKVYLSTGKAPRLPRRYRGRDIFEWADQLGVFHKTVDKLDSPAARFAPNPQLTGNHGGRALNLHQFAQDGVTLLGRLQGADGVKVRLAHDLHDNLAAADKAESELRQGIDKYIENNGLQALPADEPPPLRLGYDSAIITELDLDAAGITSVIWATGYGVDFSWLDFPIFDEYGYPVHRRGVTEQPGLYFVGLLWLHNQKSSLFLGIGEDAEHIAACIEQREMATQDNKVRA